jgi:membrane-associated phospholipid phosphatase
MPRFLHRWRSIRPWTSRFARRHPRVYLILHGILGLLLSTVFTWIFSELAEAVLSRGHLVRLDHAFAAWIEAHNTEAGEAAFSAVTYFGDTGLYAILTVVGLWYLVRRDWRHLVLIIVASGGGKLLDVALKIRFHRPRPVYSVEFGVHSPSFPSGHSMAAFIGYGLLAYLLMPRLRSAHHRRRVTAAALSIVLLIGFTRLYLDVHYLSDVAGGFAAGAAWLFVCISADRFAAARSIGDRVPRPAPLSPTRSAPPAAGAPRAPGSSSRT